jgi:hypothetical protein
LFLGAENLEFYYFFLVYGAEMATAVLGAERESAGATAAAMLTVAAAAQRLLVLLALVVSAFSVCL